MSERRALGERAFTLRLRDGEGLVARQLRGAVVVDVDLLLAGRDLLPQTAVARNETVAKATTAIAMRFIHLSLVARLAAVRTSNGGSPLNENAEESG